MSAECTAGCKTCGSLDHTSRNCQEDPVDIDSKTQFPDLKKRAPREENNHAPETQHVRTPGSTKESTTSTEAIEDPELHCTTNANTTADDTISHPSIALMVENPDLSAMNEEGIEETMIEEIIKEVAAALPACVKQAAAEASHTEAEHNEESESLSSVSEELMDIDTANKRKRKEKK